MRNLILVTDEFSLQKRLRYQRPPSRDQMNAINEAIRMANPLLIHLRSINRSWQISHQEWRRIWSPHSPSSEERQIRYCGLHAIASSPKYQGRGIPIWLWEKDGVFCPFPERALLDRWTDEDAESWFLWHIKTLREKCDRGENTTLTVTILM